MTLKNSAWQRVLNARKTDRPKALDLIPYLFDEFFELSGDRAYGDDKAILSGLAFFEGIPVTVLAQSKGRNLEENMACHFGMAHPEGYRKAMRLAKQAEKFNRPIVCIVDTAGAFPGKGAEEREVKQKPLRAHLSSSHRSKFLSLPLSYQKEVVAVL
jgi:acetyl-CoA carboxylase carboxyl transferase subunit alpha